MSPLKLQLSPLLFNSGDMSPYVDKPMLMIISVNFKVVPDDDPNINVTASNIFGRR